MLVAANRTQPPPRGTRAGVLARCVTLCALGAPDGPPLAPAAASPTPTARLRPLATDRPDRTETPFTVDRGHVQAEVELFRWVYDRSEGNDAVRTTEEWGPGAMLFKFGITSSLDLEAGIEPWTGRRVTTTTAAGTTTSVRSGPGDLTLRAKACLWGNDSDTSALALLPFLALPDLSENPGPDQIEGGLLVPFWVGLPHDLELGLGTGVAWVADAGGPGHHPEVVNSISLGAPLAPRLTGYVELWTLLDPDHPDDWQGTFDFGVNWWLSDTLKLDLGLNLGVTESAPDWNPFLGLSWKH